MFLSAWRASVENSYDTGGRGPIDDFWYGPVPAKMTSGVRVTDDVAMRLATVYACVIVISQDIAKIPLRMYQRVGKGRKLVESHPLLSVLRQPQPTMNGLVFKERLQSHELLRGNGYAEIQVGRRGEITGLRPLRADRMRVELKTDDDYRFKYTDPISGVEKTYLPSEIFHLRGLSMSGPLGLSPIDQLKESIGEGFAAQQYASSFFANDARPSLILQHPGHFKDEPTRKNWINAFRRQFGSTNRFTPMVVEYGMTIKDLPAIDHSALQFLELRKLKMNEICAAYRVPPHKVAILERSTNNNIEHQGIEYVTDCLLTHCRRWEESIAEYLLTDDERDEFYFEFELDSLMRGDAASRYDAYQKGINAGWLVRNEARRKENLDPIDGLDEPLQPVNMMIAGETPPAPGAQPGADPEPDGDESPVDPPDDAGEDTDDAQRDQGDSARRAGRGPRAARKTPANAAARARELELQARRRALIRETRALAREWERTKGEAAAFADAATSFYAWHAQFFAQALAVPLPRAVAYCTAQVYEIERAIEQKAVSAMLAAWEADAQAMQFSPIPPAPTPKEDSP